MLESLLKEIAEDNRSGAAETLKRAAEIFSMLAARPQKPGPATIEDARLIVIRTSAALVQAQPDMAPLANLASRAVRAALVAETAGRIYQAAASAAHIFIKEAESASVAACAHASALVEENSVVLTHSRSSTVLGALLKSRREGKRFRVVITESRPLLEGRALAEELAREGASVTLIADAAAALDMQRVDLVLFGADKVTPLSLVNKIGTRMIALAAQERGVAVYAICDSSKFISVDARAFFSDERRSADELWPAAPKGIAVMNRYFEPTPLSCFTKIITEEGPISVEEAARSAEANFIEQALALALGGSTT